MAFVAIWVAIVVVVISHVAPAGCRLDGLILSVLATWTVPGAILFTFGIAGFDSLYRKARRLCRFTLMLAFMGYILMVSGLTVALSVRAMFVKFVERGYSLEVLQTCLPDATTNYLNAQVRIFWLLFCISLAAGITSAVLNRRRGSDPL